MTTKDRRLTSSRRRGLNNNLNRISQEIFNIKKRYCKTCLFYNNEEGKCLKDRVAKSCFKKHLKDIG